MERIEDRLLKRLDSADFVPFEPVTFKNGEEPLSNNCHENVRRYVVENPGHWRICGWLVSAGVQCDKHSIVGRAGGDPFDITPLRAQTPFLTHSGPEEQFDAAPAMCFLNP